MAQPTEIIAGPLEVYLAAEGTDFPDIDAAVGAAWTLIGKSGTRNMSEEGLTVSHPQEFFEVTVAGSTVPQKVFRTSEGLSISFTLYDIRANEYSKILNNNTPTTTAATTTDPGQKAVNLYRGVQVEFNALLVRGAASPEQRGANAQYEVPLVWQNGSPEVVYTKGEAAGLSFEFMALYDNAQSADQGLGHYRYKFADTL